MLNIKIIILIIIFSYFLGNMSPSIILSKLYSKKDIREQGSGNAGTTNVMRTMGKKFGAIVFALDVVKGMIPAYLGLMYGGLEIAFICGLAVVLGHVFPIIYNFKGGKGVATSFGAALVLSPLFALLSISVFAMVVMLTKYVSLGSMLGACTFPLLMSIFHHSPRIKAYSLIFAIIILYSHRSNISKLIAGTENKIGKK